MHTPHAKCIIDDQRDLMLMCNLSSNSASQHRDSTNAYRLHTLAISPIGLILYFGFPMLSTYMAFVFSSIAAANAEGSSEVTNLTAIP